MRIVKAKLKAAHVDIKQTPLRCDEPYCGDICALSREQRGADILGSYWDDNSMSLDVEGVLDAVRLLNTRRW